VPAVSEKRLAIIGLGRIAAAYREVLPELPEVTLVAAVEPHPERAAAARKSGIAVFATQAEMLDAGVRPDTAIVCTPPASHLEVAEPLLHAGMDLLVEKPLAPIPDEALRVQETAARLGRTVVTAAKYRVTESLHTARRLLEAGRVGRLLEVENTFSGKLDPNAGWHGDPAISGGGVWMDNGPHSLDVVESIAGPVQRIRMIEEKREQNAAVEDEVAVETEHAGGVRGRLLLSWNRQIPAPIARCIGTDGEILVGWAQTVVRDANGEEVVAGGYDKRQAFKSLIEDFLRRRRKAESEDHGARAVGWLHAAYRSLHTGRQETL
jgi:predicted dehydrogenase